MLIVLIESNEANWIRNETISDLMRHRFIFQAVIFSGRKNLRLNTLQWNFVSYHVDRCYFFVQWKESLKGKERTAEIKYQSSVSQCANITTYPRMMRNV